MIVSAYNILNWHDHLLAQGLCQSLRTTRETLTIRLDIEYRVEAHTKEHSRDVQLRQSILDETTTTGQESN